VWGDSGHQIGVMVMVKEAGAGPAAPRLLMASFP
jgi:hypothetical protein